jgi:hypothetical protein
MQILYFLQENTKEIAKLKLIFIWIVKLKISNSLFLLTIAMRRRHMKHYKSNTTKYFSDMRIIRVSEICSSLSTVYSQ